MVNDKETENFTPAKVADNIDGFEEHHKNKEKNDYNKTKLINIILLGIVFMTSGSRYYH